MSAIPLDRNAIKTGLKAKFPLLKTHQERAHAELCERKLSVFMRSAWRCIEPGAFIDGCHIDLICNHLQAVSEGKIRKLLMNIPPRYMKSLMTSVLFPAWEWTRRPRLRYLAFSYNKDLSIRDNLRCRRLLEHPWYQARWGNKVQFAKDQNAKTRYENLAGGYRLALATAGAVGEGGDRYIIDDPNSLDSTDSPDALQKVIDWWIEAMGLRDNDPQSTARILIMQRLDENDLTGHILKNEDDWVHLCLPMEYEPARHCITPFGQDWRREEGEPLWPERHGGVEQAKEYIQQLKGPKGLPVYVFAGQAQQRPVPAKGGIFERDWFKLYDQLPEVEEQPYFFTTWDTAVKKTDSGSWTVGLALAYFASLECYFIIDQIRFREEYPVQEQAVYLWAQAMPWCQAHIVEDKANGAAIIASLKYKVKGIDGFDPTPYGDKPTRWRSISPRVKAGQVLVPSWAPWVKEFLDELGTVPKTPDTDQADALSNGILWNEFKRLGAGKGIQNVLVGRPGTVATDFLSQVRRAAMMRSPFEL